MQYASIPQTPLYGQASKMTGPRIHQTYQEALKQSNLHASDPRLAVRDQDVAPFRDQPPATLESIALRLTQHDGHHPQGRNDMRVLGAIHASRTLEPSQLNVDADYGPAGRLARGLEVAGLRIHQDGMRARNDDDIIKGHKLLAIAAAAHNLGAREAASAGYANTPQPSVVAAAAFQGRPVEHVVGDLVKHSVMDRHDPRVAIAQSGTIMEPRAALEAIATERPRAPNTNTYDTTTTDSIIATHGVTTGRRAEARALSMLSQPNADEATRAKATTMLTGALSMAHHRHELMMHQSADVTLVATRTATRATSDVAR